MKRVFALFLSVMLVMINFSCTSDELREELSGPPDLDHSNVVGDEVSGNIVDNTNETPDNNTTKPDENITLDKEQEIPDESEPVKECGNEKTEYEERCDSPTPVDCASLNPSMKGITYCLNNCEGYDMQECEVNGKGWGLLNLRFQTNFILDEAKIGDFSYFSKGALPYAAFNGVYGSPKTHFPSTDQNISFAATNNYQGSFGGNKRQLTVKQNTLVGGSIGYPRHELEFSPGSIKKGSEYRINGITLDLIDSLLKLVRYRLIDYRNGSECIMGLGYSGTVFINNVVPDNVDLFDGGSIEIVANNVDFFHPDDFPGLDEENPQVPAEVLKYLVCPK